MENDYVSNGLGRLGGIGNIPSLQAERKSPSISGSLSSLEDEVKQLNEALAQLAERLEPVMLRPRTAEDKAPKAVEPGVLLCNSVARLEALYRDVAAIRAGVNVLMRSLQI